MINEILLDERFDDWICGNLMWIQNFGWEDISIEIQDSGKKGHERIYKALKEIEKVKGIKL
jgi:hypothetical protein